MTDSSYTCIIADDDEIDRLTTTAFVKQHPQLRISGVFASAAAVLEAVTDPLPDIAFFDIDMPGLSGLELRRRLSGIPACVFITAYPEYAVDSFELEAIDFLVKPVKADRFARTVARLEAYLATRRKAALLEHTLGAGTVFIREGHSQVKLQLHEIIYLEALKDYTRIVTRHKKHTVLSSLGSLLKENAFGQFVRIHRSYAVQKHFIEQVKAEEVTAAGISLPLGRSFKTALQQLNS